MKLIYCYIAHFRNIENQEVSLSDEFVCHYRESKLLIEKQEKNPLMDYIYDNGFMSNIKIYNPQNEMLPFHKTKCSETQNEASSL